MIVNVHWIKARYTNMAIDFVEETIKDVVHCQPQDAFLAIDTETTRRCIPIKDIIEYSIDYSEEASAKEIGESCVH